MRRSTNYFLTLISLVLGVAFAAGAPAGTTITNQAFATYQTPAGQLLTSESEAVTFTVLPVYDFIITPDGTEADPGQFGAAAPGADVTFVYTVTNQGNISDTITLTPVQSGTDGFDLENIRFYADLDNSGTLTSGDLEITSVEGLEPDESRQILVIGTVPAGVAEDSLANLNLTGSSSGAPGNSDANNWAQAVAEAEPVQITGVNLGNGDTDPDSPPSDTPEDFPTSAGTPVSYLVELTNTGEALDSFELTTPNLPTGWSAEIFADANCDGVADSDVPLTNTGELAPNENACFVVTVTPPITQTPGSTPITLTATSDNDPAVSDSLINTVTVAGEDVAGVNIGNGDANPTTSPSDTPVTFPTTPGIPVSYPLELTNTGNVEDTFDLSIPGLPTGWTAQIFPDADCDGSADGATPAAATGALAPGGNACFVVTVTPPADAAPGSTPIAVTATSRNDPGVTDSITNSVTLADEGGAGVNIGTSDGDPGTVPGDLGTDVPAEPGTPVNYSLELTNTGDTEDSFVLDISDLPAGWTAEVFADADCDGAADNATPLASVGPLDPAQNVCLVVTVTPPANAAPGDTPVTVTATSENDPTVSDSIETTIVIGAEAQPGVNIGNGDADAATAPSDTGATLPATPGTPLSYPLELTNTGTAPDTFDLTPSVPTGWSAQIFPDTNCDGEADSAAPLSNVGPLDPGENACFVVSVTPPLDAAPGDTPVTVTATSQNDPAVSDSLTNTVTVEGDEPALGVAIGNGDEDTGTPPSATGITIPATPGAPVSYPIELTNTGDVPDSFELDIPGLPSGWTAEVFPDADCDGSADGLALTNTGSLDPAQNVCFVVTVTPPAGAAPGSIPITVTATSDNDPSVSDSITNTVVIGDEGGDAGVNIGNGDENTGTAPSDAGVTLPATPGTPLGYPLELTNTGDETDTFALTLPNVPTGWEAEIFADADCNGVADSSTPIASAGPLEPGETICLVVIVTPPADAGAGTTPITVTATSANDPTVSDSITNTLTVQGGGEDEAGVDIGNGDENPGTGPSDSSVSVPAIPGTPASYPLELTNTGDAPDTFTLTLPNLPAGWTAQIFPDANCDGMADSGSPLTSVGPLDPGENVCLVVTLTPPAEAAPGTTPITVTATSGNDPAMSDSITNTVVIEDDGGEDAAGVDIGNGDGNAGTDPSDTSRAVPAVAGTPVSYPIELTNTGDTTDSFGLTLPNVPAGWTAQIFADANCDGAPDSPSPLSSVGPLAPGENVCLVVTVTPPAGAGSGSTPITVTATSSNDPSVSDSITNTLVISDGGGGDDEAGVDLGNGDGNPDSPPSDSGKTISAKPGIPVSYPLEVTNTGDTADSFTLTLPNLPSGWTAQLLPDANCDGEADSGSPISSVGPLEPGENACFIVLVTLPADAAPGSTPITVTATSGNDPAVSDSITNTLVIERGGGGEDGAGVDIGNGDRNPGTGPDNTGKTIPAQPGKPVSYPLELTNTGDAPDTFTLTLPNVPAGWTAQIFPDANCDGAADSGTPITSVGPLEPGENVCFVVSVTPPANAAPGSTPITVTATSGNDPSVNDSITNTVIVERGGGGEETEPEIVLTKSVTPAGAVAVGDTLTYTVTARNTGDAAAANTRLYDPLPGGTAFVSASASTTLSGDVLYSVGGSSWSESAPTSLPAGGSLYVGVDTNGDATVSEADSFAVSGSLTLTLSVRVTAGNSVSNVAQASYNGKSATSNTVSSPVGTDPTQPPTPSVCDVRVTPDGSVAAPAYAQTAAAGSVVYLPYTLTNLGDAGGDFELQRFVLDESTLEPTGTRILLDSNANGARDAGEAAVGTLDDLDADETVALLLEVTLGADPGTLYVNLSARCRGDTDNDTLDADNVSEITVTAGSLSVPVKTAEPAAGTSLYAGAAVSYTISFSAEGGDQTDVVVEDIIDDDLELPLSYTSGTVTDPATGLTTEAVATLSGRTLTWTFAEVPAGMSVNLNVAAVVRRDAVPPATVDNIACVSAPKAPPLCSAPVSHNLAPVELELTKTAMRQQVAIGERLTFELVATNPSAVVPLLGGRLTDPLPEGLEYLPGSAVRLTAAGTEEAFEPTQTENTLVWTLPDLAPGASLTIRFDTRVTTAAIGQDELRNDAELEGIGSDGGVVADDEDDAVVEIDDTLFRARSVLLGHAYTDEDDSGDFSDGDKPVENVRLYLSNGISVVTDEFGRYTVTDLPSGLLALRLDGTTTGELDSLTTPTATHEGLWRVRLLPGLITRQDIPFAPRPEAAEAPMAVPVPEAQRDPNLPPSPVETLTGVNLLAPADGEIVRGRNSVPIIIEAPLGDTVTLSVNGQLIPASLLGTQVLDEARGRQRLEYVGVRLTEGDNDLVVSSTPEGAEPILVQRQVALAGRPATVVITPDGSLSADSAQPLAFTLLVEDENGNPPADMYVTLEADGASFASEDANPRAVGMQVQTEGGAAAFTLEPLPQPAPIEIRAKLQGLEAKAEFAVKTAERPWVGAAAGSLGASYAPGEPLEFGVSGTLFARGSLFGGLLTVGGRYPESVYGEPTDPFTLLPDDEVVDPELVTGSSGPTRREARSEDGVYFRFEDNLSFVQYGDFTTDLLGPLLGGGRELTGLSGRYASFGGGLDVRGYASYRPQGDEVTGRDVPSNGTSLYLLPSGIESLRVSAISKDDAGVVIAQDDLGAGTDYRFTPQTGELFLSTALPLQDELGNRNFLRLSYRFPTGVGAPRVLEAGAQVAYDTGAFAPRFGIAQAQNGALSVRALSAGASYDGGDLTGSADLAYGGDDLGAGLAATAEATYDGDTLDGSASYSYVSPDYASPDLGATTDVGQDIRFGVSFDVSEVLTLAANTQASQTPETGDAWRLGADALASYRLREANTELQGGLEYDDGSVRGLAGVRFREPLGLRRAEVSVLHRQGVTAGSTSETDFGVSYAILENLALTLTETVEWGIESNLLVGLETGVDNTDLFGGSGYAGRTTLSTQYELPGGVSAQEGRARLGLSTAYPVSDAFSVDGSLEQILDFTGEGTDQTVGTAGVTYDADDLDAEGRAQLSFEGGALKQVYSAGSNFRLSDNLFGGVNALYSSDTASETPQGFSFNVAGAYRSLALDVLTSHTVRLGSLAPETGDELSGDVRAVVPFGVLFDLRGSYLYRSEADLGLIDMSALGASVYPWNGGSVTLYGQLFHLWLEDEFVGGASLELSQEVICGLYAVGGYNYGGLEDPLGPGYGGSGFFVRVDLIMDEQFLCEGLAE